MLRQETHTQWPCMGRGWPLSYTTYVIFHACIKSHFQHNCLKSQSEHAHGMTLAGNHVSACLRSGVFRIKAVHRNVQVGLKLGNAS